MMLGFGAVRVLRTHIRTHTWPTYVAGPKFVVLSSPMPSSSRKLFALGLPGGSPMPSSSRKLWDFLL